MSEQRYAAAVASETPDELQRLYYTSPSFNAAVNCLDGFVSLFLAGAAVDAREREAANAAAVAAIMNAR